jgi:hypothetical protein
MGAKQPSRARVSYGWNPPIADSPVGSSVPSCLPVLPPRLTPAEFVLACWLPPRLPFRPV